MSAKIPGLRSPAETLGGIVYIGRMLDKIRLHLAGKLPEDFHSNLGKGFDGRCAAFLKISYAALVHRIAGDPERSDDELLAWIFSHGHQPDDEQIEVWNGFMTKRGWRDEASPILLKRKAEGGFADRADIETMFNFIDADEGRL
jgi:gluconokinase